MKKINEQLSVNRTFLMGLACLWIVFQHLQLKLNFYPLWALGRFGFTQVDVFMLLSGFGIAYSLEKSGEVDVFLKKRFLKVLPTYYVLVVLYIIYNLALSENKITSIDMLGVITCTSFWYGGDFIFSWYVQAILFFYILSPVIYALIKKGYSIHLIVISVILSIAFVRSGLEIGISRMTAFILGMSVVGIRYNDKNGKLIKKGAYVASIISILLVASVELFIQRKVGDDYRLIFLPLFLLPLGECLLFAKCADILRKNNFSRYIVRGFEFIGKFSLEIYLTQTLFNLVSENFTKAINSIVTYNLIRIGVAILSIAFAILISKCIDVEKKRLLQRG